MQQEIKLTNESSNTVFVDDVDVSKGVYGHYTTENDRIVFVFQHRHSSGKKGEIYAISNVASREFFQDNIFKELSECVQSRTDLIFYTIPDNKRIITEREVTIDDLKNTDHVGFVTDFGQKGHVVCVSGKDGLFTPVTSNAGISFGSNSENTFKKVSDAVMVENSCDRKTNKVYRFDTRKELYQWLAE